METASSVFGPGLQTSRAARAELSPRIDLISENEPRRAARSPSRDREWDLESRLVSARFGVLGVLRALRMWPIIRLHSYRRCTFLVTLRGVAHN